MMISRHEGHGSFAKQFLKEGSMGAIIQGSHLHSHHAYSSGEILSPRSVLEQRALSGLAIAIDLEDKMKLSPQPQENVALGRFFSKHSIMHMSVQEAHAKENITVGRFLSRERLNHVMYMKHDEREALTGDSSVGLKMVISMHQVNKQAGKEQEKLMMGRSLSKERLRQMMHMNDEERERKAVSGVSNGGQMVGASSEGERKQCNVCTSGKTARSSEDHLLKSPLASSCQTSSSKSRQSTWRLHDLGHVQQSFPATVEDSIFYYAATNPPPPSSSHHHHVVGDGCQAYYPIEDFLQCCYFCKHRLGAGKDIYMYRGDQAFCSVECRYEQIAKDECMGASAL